MRKKRLKVLVIASMMLLGIAIPFFLQGQSSLQVGYTIVTADAGANTPVGTALFTYTNSSGVLVSEAGVGASFPTKNGRIYVDQVGAETGIALVNSTSFPATATLILRDSSGVEVARAPLSLTGRAHVAKYVSQLFGAAASGLRGSMTFESDQALAAITLREVRNSRGEPLYTTLPVADLNLLPTGTAIGFPHIAVGEGYTTQVILINPRNEVARGTLSPFASNGSPLRLSLNGVAATSFNYTIEPHGTFSAEFESTAGLSSGWMISTVTAGAAPPIGAAVFRLKAGGQIVTEAAVPNALITNNVRIFVDNAGTKTGLAVVNPTNTAGTLTFRLLNQSGGVEATTTRSHPAGNHLAIFADQLFPTLTEGFNGVMEIRSTSALSAVTLKLTTNTRGELVMTTLPVANMAAAATTGLALLFPHIAIGGEFSTRVILVNTNTTGTGTGRVNFFKSDSTDMTVALGAQVGNQFTYEMASSGGRQLLPGAAPSVGRITIIDPATNTESREVVVNEGSSVQPRLLVLDSNGQPRTDLQLTYTSSNPNIATVDAMGNITGRRAGFSTLVITASGVVASATITVVRVDAGVAGFAPTGITQDLSQRLYMASSSNHTVLLANTVASTPSIYAGIDKSPGLTNAVRLQSRFRAPGFIEFNQSEGSVYVADAENHIIRRVRPGADGQVETLAGTGSAGGRDGTLAEATFNNPQGLALDDRGYLWIADSANHVIRRANIATGTVETIAGLAGVSGSADGAGSEARFNLPMGISIEPESDTAQLERERTGAPLPPTTVLVADSGNGLIRRVSDTRQVETIRIENVSAAGLMDFKTGRRNAVGDPLKFTTPTGVAVDSSENIYVTEPGSGRMRLILSTGEVVSGTQGGTFRNPVAVTSTESGKTVVADSASSPRQVSYAAPVITSVTPLEVSSRGNEIVTVRGNNFAPESVVVVGGFVVRATIANTETLTFTTPQLGGGRTTISIYHRGGLGQGPLSVRPIPLNELGVGQITTVAGGTTYTGDGGPAANARISTPEGVALDGAGNLYIADTGNNKIRRIDAKRGVINTVAGNGEESYSGDGGSATAAALNNPSGVAIDPSGNIFIADRANHRIRKVDSSSGTITTIAGTTRGGFAGDGGSAVSAQLNFPSRIAIDRLGNIYLTDTYNHRVRKIAIDGTITTIAGSGPIGLENGTFAGDDGPATEARLNQPRGITVDRVGNIYVVDTANHRVRRINAATGVISTFAGIGNAPPNTPIGDNGPATSAMLRNPWGINLDSDGNLYIGDVDSRRVRKVDVGTRIITTAAGNGVRTTTVPPEIVATEASFDTVFDPAVDAAGNLYLSDILSNRIYRVAGRTRIISTIVGATTASVGDGGPATLATLNQPTSILIDPAGNLLIADTWNHRIRVVDPRTGIIRTVAGTGFLGIEGDRGPATSAQLQYPRGMSFDRSFSLYFADTSNVRVRRISAGVISTIAGNGRTGFSGDGGNSGLATMNKPVNTAVDSAGNVYVSDVYNHRVRRISTDGTITTIAGNGAGAFSGDNGPAESASLQHPDGLAVDSSGNLLIADSTNNRVRKVNLQTGVITTIAGAATNNPSSNLATMVTLVIPLGVAVDAIGNVYLAESTASRIGRISPNGIIQRIAGILRQSYSGDGGAARDATFRRPSAVAVDSSGNVYIADTYNGRIRAIKGPVP